MPPNARPRRRRGALSKRVAALLDALVNTMESDVKDGKDPDATQMRLLETMVKTLERLNALEKDQKARTGGGRSPAEAAALREKLAERIAALDEE